MSPALALALPLAFCLPQASAQEDPSVAAGAQVPPVEVPMPRFEVADLPAWRDYLLPTAEEAAFEDIPWQPTFADGLRAAAEAQRPLLLWVMNGHPLGCT